jgi:hypothetical protein
MVAFRARDARIRSVAAQQASVTDALRRNGRQSSMNSSPGPVGAIGLDRRVPFIVIALLGRDVQAAVDTADFQHFMLADDLSVFPKQ